MRIYKIFTDYAKEEKWLNEMANEGYEVVSTGCGYKFKNITPEDAVYKIDFRTFKSKNDFLDYCTMFEDCGWKHISGTKSSGKQYFKKISDDGDDDLNPDDLDDDELQKLDAELSGGSYNSDNEEKLTPEEEIQADDMMAVAATTLLVNDKLSGDEKKEFCSSESETATAIREGFMTEADINEMAAECGLITEAKYTNKMIIRLDAESKKKQLYALAVNVSAAAHNDPDYIKLKKVMKMRKILRAKLDRKYHGEAMKRMKVYYARLRNSKSNTLRKVSK